LLILYKNYFYFINSLKKNKFTKLGIGDWGLGIGDWGLGGGGG